MAEPRLKGQRWCRGCFTAYRRQQRAKRRGDLPPPPVSTPGQDEAPLPPGLVRFWCRDYPFFQLKVAGVGWAKFQRGLLETDDPRIIEALRRHGWYGGIITEGEPPPPQETPSSRPVTETRPRRRRTAWLGMP